MGPRGWIVVGSLLGGLGVALGAFGAHGLPKRLESAGWNAQEIARRTELHETAARYQMTNATAILCIGLLGMKRRARSLTAAGWLLLVGTVLFSGLLYALVFAGPEKKWLGAVVPLGGASMIAGWLMLAVAGFTVSEEP